MYHGFPSILLIVLVLMSARLACLGSKVVVNYFNHEEDARDTIDIIKESGGQAIAVYGDMTKQTDVDRLLKKTIENYGGEVHNLVNVVGGLVARKKLEEMNEEFWDCLMNVNLKSVFLVTKAVVPHMKPDASIINFASQAGRDGGGPGASAYATAKGAVMTFTRAMAKELGPKNIRVNALCPGMIATTFHDTFTTVM